MKRTTVYLDEATDLELSQLARQQGRAKAELMREALTTYVERQHRPRPLPRSVGLGRSGIPNLAEQDEVLLKDIYEQKLARMTISEEPLKDSQP